MDGILQTPLHRTKTMTAHPRTNLTRTPHAVASLGWVSPGAATEGVTPLFLVASSAVSPLTTFFCLSRVSPPRGCHPTPVLPVRPRCSTIFCKFAHKKNYFLRVSPPWRVSPLAVRPLATTSDATAPHPYEKSVFFRALMNICHNIVS